MSLSNVFYGRQVHNEPYTSITFREALKLLYDFTLLRDIPLLLNVIVNEDQIWDQDNTKTTTNNNIIILDHPRQYNL